MGGGASAAVRRVCAEAVRELIQRVDPALAEEFEVIERAAHAPMGLFVGDQRFTAFAMLLRTLADVLETEGERIYWKSTGKEHAAEEISGTTCERVKRHVSIGDRFCTELAKIIKERIDDFIPTITPRVMVTEEAKDALRRCVVQVQNGDAISTAFALCAHGHFLTAAHVVGDMNSVTLVFNGGGEMEEPIEFPAKVIHCNKDKDIAVLHVDDNRICGKLQTAGLKPPRLAFNWRPRGGDPVLCIGYQEQHIFTGRPRWIGARIDPFDPVSLITFGNGPQRDQKRCLVLNVRADGPFITYGTSGGPVLNLGLQNPAVIGMVIGAGLPAWKKVGGGLIQLSPAHGFAVLLTDVADSWPGLSECCLALQEV